jgi:predicted small secreted protein
MKKIIFILSVLLLLSILITSCNSNGNTGNGANDPTSTYEPNNLKDAKDVNLQQQNSDSMNITVDTMAKKNKY